MQKFFAAAATASLLAFAHLPAQAGALSPLQISPEVTTAQSPIVQVSCGGVDCDAPRRSRRDGRGARIAAGIALGLVGALAARQAYAGDRYDRHDRYDRYEGRHERRCRRWRRACRWDDNFRACRRYDRNC
jgi:hypothetical protein